MIEKLSIVEPTEYTDNYKPYKYGVIFKERLFCHNDVHGVVSLKLFKKTG